MRIMRIIKRYVYCIKNVKPSHFHDVTEKDVFWFTLVRKSYRGFENAEFLDRCSFHSKTENFGFCTIPVQNSFALS